MEASRRLWGLVVEGKAANEFFLFLKVIDSCWKGLNTSVEAVWRVLETITSEDGMEER